MKDFTILSMVAILQEMLGGLFWPAAVAAVAAALLLVAALVRQHGFHGRAARIGLAAGVVAAAVAMLAAPALTQSEFANLHGLLDWGLLAAIGLAAFLGCAATVFALFGAATEPQRRA